MRQRGRWYRQNDDARTIVRNFPSRPAKSNRDTVAILARPNLAAASALHTAGALLPRLGSPGSSALARSVDHARISALYKEHSTRIFRFLRDLLGDAAVAADATQETFVRALKKLPDLQPLPGDDHDRDTEGSPSLAPWLFGIARNVSLEIRRSRFRATKYFAPAPPDVDFAGHGSPETDYLGREALHIVNRTLEDMSEERRAMLLLRLDHGLSYDDIAVTMGCSLAKVKVEIFRARQVLRAAMTDDVGARGSDGRSSGMAPSCDNGAR